MNDLLISLGLVIAIMTLPVMLAARYLKTEKTGFSPALLSVILQLALYQIAGYVIASPVLTFIVSIIGGTLIFSMVLDTTLVKGFIFSVCFVSLATLIGATGMDFLKSTTVIAN